MIELMTYGPTFGQAAASPFCVKAMMLLNMAGEKWTPVVLTDPRKMPMAKLPVIRADGELIANSDNIRAWLEARGTDFDDGLTAQERAQSRAMIRMAEEHLYFHVVYDRWADDSVWPIIRDTYFADIPRPIRGIITNCDPQANCAQPVSDGHRAVHTRGTFGPCAIGSNRDPRQPGRAVPFW